MKYCLSSRQTKIYLNKADEISVESRDYRQISDLFIDYPDKMIILDIPTIDFEEKIQNAIIQYGEISENFCCRIYNLNLVNWFKEHNIKFYYGYPINNYYDARGLVDLGVEYIKITAPLTFDMNGLKNWNVKFRMVPNVAYDAYIPRTNGIYGQWVRPEDVNYYENTIYAFEFEDADLTKERTLYDIYAENGNWPGNINLLLTNLNRDADNRGLPEEFGEIRSNCRQRCMMDGACHFCETAFNFEKSIRKYKYELDKEKLEN